jgi:hypothetical protein
VFGLQVASENKIPERKGNTEVTFFFPVMVHGMMLPEYAQKIFWWFIAVYRIMDYEIC